MLMSQHSEWEQGKERAVWDDVSLVSLLSSSTLFTLCHRVQSVSHPSMPSCWPCTSLEIIKYRAVFGGHSASLEKPFEKEIGGNSYHDT